MLTILKAPRGFAFLCKTDEIMSVIHKPIQTTNTIMIYTFMHTHTHTNTCVCARARVCGLGSSVSTATDYRLDGPGSNPGGDEIFRLSRPALGPTQPPAKWVPGLSQGVKCSWSVLLTTHPLLMPRSWKSRAIVLPTLWATPGL